MRMDWTPGWTRPVGRTLVGMTLALGVAGCATIIKGSTQKLAVASTPSAATVSIDGVSKGSTPVTIDLKRGAEYALRIDLAGYQPYEMKLTKGLNGWVWGNIIFGGPLGVIIDASTGAMYKVKPEAVNASLIRGDLTVRPGRDGLFIGVTLSADSSWDCIGNLTPVPSR